MFKTFQSIAPRLRKMDDGSIYVAGGIEETPQTAHESLLAGQDGGGPPDAPPNTPAPASISSAPAGANAPVTLPGQHAVVPAPDVTSPPMGVDADRHVQ